MHIPLQRSDWSGSSLLGFASLPFSTLESNRLHFLHGSELSYFENIPYKRAKYQYLLSRYTAKCALARYLKGANIRAISIIKGIFSQPLINYSRPPIPDISLAHTRDVGACIVFPPEHPMGIDIEFPKDENLESIAQSITPREGSLRTKSLEIDLYFYTRLWTVKEALSKVLLTGLTTPLTVYEVNRLIIKENYTISYFKNFTQYKAISFWIGNCICSIVLPKMTECFPSVWISSELNTSAFNSLRS